LAVAFHLAITALELGQEPVIDGRILTLGTRLQQRPGAGQCAGLVLE
jgi:hypothetical protein